ncbi:hypothetical protein VTK56DRAFT_7564 [Thermocarpiscus australiensis]
MPKRRHQNKYSKPQSTPPALLSSTAASRNRSHHDAQSHGRGVNELLAELRRAGPSGSAPQPPPDLIQPTVPPTIRQLLQLPETPPPNPRRPVRVDAAGRRLPPGPAPPRSWLSGPASAARGDQRTAVDPSASRDSVQRPLPGLNLPGRGSLVDMVLRRFALDWEWQRSYCRYYLYELPTHLRVAMVAYLGMHTREGVSLRDLQALLLPPPDVPHYQADPDLAPGTVNETFRHLHLAGSIGRSLKLRELTDLLFPPQSSTTPTTTITPQESWDAPEQPAPANLPRPLLPNLTHLSLALDPSSSSSVSVSWRHLLSLAARLPGLTHLSLAHWPPPTLTPNAVAAVVVSPQGAVHPYGGTGFYSHALDDDWAEAVAVLRRLSRRLYGLEYLDLTGCSGWFPALWASTAGGGGGEDGEGEGEGGEVVDWAGSWGKVGTLVMDLRHPCGGLQAGAGGPIQTFERAGMLERHIRSQRRQVGNGTPITVETMVDGRARKPPDVRG